MNVKTKISKIQIFRMIIQIIGFILMPGAFILAFSGLKDIYTAILAGNFSFSQNILKAVEVVALIPVTIIFGRFFCGWLCAFGTFNDLIYLVSSKVFKIKFRVNEELDKSLKYLKYIVLLSIALFVWTLGSTLFAAASPWDAFAQLPSFSDAIAQYTLGSIFLLLIIVGAMFIERFFCRYLCPLGAIFAITSKLRVFDISKKRDKCGKCRICTNSCSMGIQMYEHDKITSGECINCFKCIEACPRRNTKLVVAEEHISPVLATCVALGSFTALYSGASVVSKSAETASVTQNSQLRNNLPDNFQLPDNTQANNQNTQINNQNSSANNQNTQINSQTSQANSQNTQSSSQNKKYKDGTYTGTANGYRPGLQVSVTIKNGQIADIQIGSNNETPRFANQAFSTMPGEIVKSQSTQVDGVSGATRTSNGIKNAVEMALSKAQM